MNFEEDNKIQNMPTKCHVVLKLLIHLLVLFIIRILCDSRTFAPLTYSCILILGYR